MNLHNSTASIFVPDGKPVTEALSRVTHLGIGAHQDDLEFMAYHGILACYGNDQKWFGGITCTNGSGSSRTGPYAGTTRRANDGDTPAGAKHRRSHWPVRAMIQLDYPSSAVKSPTDSASQERLESDSRPPVRKSSIPIILPTNMIPMWVSLLPPCKPCAELPREERPGKVWACEIWRNLDWLNDSEKVLMDVSGRDNLAAALNGVFDSQIVGGKRYDLATAGRRSANATFFESHATDKTTQLIFGMDLLPLVADEALDILDYVYGFIDRLKTDVRQRLGKRLGKSEA